MTGDAIETTLGHRFQDPALLDEALTHPSAQRRGLPANGTRRPLRLDYERLEFLGDRVLGLSIADMLWRRFPAETEGALSRRLNELVRKETLAAVAVELDLARHVHLPLSEAPAARDGLNLLADVCEAVIAALYLDGGFEVAGAFIRRHWTARMEAALAPPKDPKTAVQEWAQARGLGLPAYRLLATDGPPHQPRFTVSIELTGREPAVASGASKRLAEAAAATLLLEQLVRPPTP